ncbi:Bax inhibitor-1/YccA family protein [Tessaracoccus sp. OH4464_COT-324]|uniref:Bax inhibitor-1/YccA family protein n=1 Tax=Tessaracoccus sp. OH4464_COT-324 TaxID=2491059 RepID=UPI000F634CEF|nr:Bax inhibitor-1/YccA family protein [Tessaracoccus sp. OH4464_COT-324]RRD45246.1 Bax inhibitor-1/YccA family protein [Tessaracoccus sp. OH4464_COT-324]
MANMVFGRGEGFTKHHQGAAPAGYAGPGYGFQQPGFGQPGQPGPMGYQQPGYPLGAERQAVPTGDVMTYDDVIAKTGISLGLVFLVAAAVFAFVPIRLSLPLMIVGALASFVTVLVVAFRPKVSPVSVAIYALFEGLFIGGVSKYFETLYPGIVMQAVLATFVTAAATLAVMKFANIRVSARFRQMVTIGTFALAGVFLVNLVFSLLGWNLGIVGVGGNAGMLAIIVSVIAVALAVFNLVMDFDSVRVGVENRVPASESWRAALGITVTMVWLYVEILRILSYFRD